MFPHLKDYLIGYLLSVVGLLCGQNIKRNLFLFKVQLELGLTATSEPCVSGCTAVYRVSATQQHTKDNGIDRGIN